MRAFMAMAFNAPDVEEALTQCFRPAAERAGLSLNKLTDAQGAGLIDNQIRAAIRSARLVIADLSTDNNGAYFEAGFAEGLRVPVIYTCRADKFREKKTHFDTNHMKTVPWDLSDLKRAENDLVGTIRNTLPDVAKMVDEVTADAQSAS
jgi:nucleoside 2-deoxyribosyltransferase